MNSGEMPIELGYSWFSAKCIKVQRLFSFPRVLILLDTWPHIEEHLLVNLRRWAKIN